MIDFLCIGAQKAGTTWLIENLKAHPSVWTPPFIKEIHYFDKVHLGGKKENLLKRYRKKIQKVKTRSPGLDGYLDMIIDPKFAFTDAWYEHIFSIAPKDRIKGECTPLYSALNDEGVAHVRRIMPNVRLIYMIRDPFDRAMSSLRWAMDLRKTTDSDSVSKLPNKKKFKSRGEYSENITRWERIFDPSQILYIPFGHIKSQPAQVMRDVERHLKISPFSDYPVLNEAVHPTNKKDIIISSDIIDKVKREAQPQYAYLSQRFGDEFLAATK